MSRCFPFPPPGYEKKTRTEDINLLVKEKHKEKKHKKEKRGKDKKEGKEKREKDRRDEKQEEKKEKKEKHRDKKKDKEKYRDKDKNILVTSVEKELLGHAGAEKGEKNFEKSNGREMEKSTVYNGVVLGKNSALVPENKNFKQLHGLGNNIAIEEGTSSNPFAQKAVGLAQDRVEGVARQMEKNAECRMEVKVKIRGIEGDGKKGEKRNGENREKSIEKCKEKDKKIKVDRSKDAGGEILVEQSRIKDCNKIHADRPRGKDVNKKDFLVVQTARPAKLVKKEDNNASAAADALEIPRKRKDFGLNGVLCEGDVGPNKRPRVMSSSLPMAENGRRASQNSTNLFAPVKQQALSHPKKQDEGDIGPSKMARITPSSFSMTENERSLQPSQDFIVSTPVKQQALSKVKQDLKDHRINGTNNSPQSASKSTAPADRNSGAVKKLLPHPDTKYLTQVLSVPKMEDLSAVDEQDWLFSSSYLEVNKPKAKIYQVDDRVPQVWAEGLRIESVDVFALPYVIPR